MNRLLVVSALVMVAGVVATILATVLRKLARDRRERRAAAAQEEVRPAVFAFVASDGEEVDDLRRVLTTGSRRQQRRRRVAVEELLLGYGGKLRGEVVDAIRRFFVQEGFAAEARAQLRARSPWDRAVAAQELGFVGDRAAVPGLVAALQDRDPAVRIVAARALGQIGDRAAAHPLLVAADGRRAVPYGAASQALLRIGLPAVPAMEAALRHPSFRVRRLAVDVLGELGVTQVRDELVRILRSDRDTIVRIRAAHALGRVGTAEVLAELYDSMHGENAELRQSIVRAVTDIGARSSLPVLRRALEDVDHPTARLAARRMLEWEPEGVAILRAAAASGVGRSAVYALEALDEVEPVGDVLRAGVRSWDPVVVARPVFPATGRTDTTRGPA
ncbi:MAG: HEAT repeat domain-containing protein [Actinomycetes bacterium]